jgi:hypothetical protein
MSDTTMRAHAVAEPTQVGLDAPIRNCLYVQYCTIDNKQFPSSTAITVEVCSAYKDNCQSQMRTRMPRRTPAKFFWASDAIRKRLKPGAHPSHDRHRECSKHNVQIMSYPRYKKNYFWKQKATLKTSKLVGSTVDTEIDTGRDCWIRLEIWT